MYFKKLVCESCGANLNTCDIGVNMQLGISKIGCPYCGTTTVLSMGSSVNNPARKTVKPYVVVLSINAESANVRLNGVERVVKSSELRDLLMNDKIELDILSRAKLARVFNIDLDAIADLEADIRGERLSDFLNSL